MTWQSFLASEHWKRTAFLGWIGFLGVLIRYLVTGDDPGTNIVGLVVLTLGIAGGWQLGKRATHNPTRNTWGMRNEARRLR